VGQFPEILHIYQTALDTGYDLSFFQSRCMIHWLFPGHAPDHLFRYMLHLDRIEWHLITPIEPYLYVEDDSVTSRCRRALTLYFRQKSDPASNLGYLLGCHRYCFSSRLR